MNERIALVGAEGTVVVIREPREDSHGVVWHGPIALNEFVMDGGTVQRVDSTVQVGDQWPGVCEWTLHKAVDIYKAYYTGGCGYQTTHYPPSPFCPTCGKAVSVEGEA